MKVLICVVLFKFMVHLNSIGAIPETLYDIIDDRLYHVDARNRVYQVDSNNRTVGHVPGTMLRVLRDREGHYFILDIEERVVPYELPYYTLYDSEGKFYLVRLDDDKLMDPCPQHLVGSLLVDLQGRHYTVLGDYTVLPERRVRSGPQPPPAYPIDGDTINRDRVGNIGTYESGVIIPPRGGHHCRYIPEAGDVVERYTSRTHDPWSMYWHKRWIYLVY